MDSKYLDQESVPKEELIKLKTILDESYLKAILIEKQISVTKETLKNMIEKVESIL